MQYIVLMFYKEPCQYKAYSVHFKHTKQNKNSTL